MVPTNSLQLLRSAAALGSANTRRQGLNLAKRPVCVSSLDNDSTPNTTIKKSLILGRLLTTIQSRNVSVTGRHMSSSSESSGGIFSYMRSKFETREKNKAAAKLIDQINLMANASQWTLQHFSDEVDETLSSWRTKLPSVMGGNTKQLEATKDAQKIIKAMLSHKRVGGEATAQTLQELDRKTKLQISVESKTPMDDINIMIQQFRQMEIMHRILKYRKDNGLSLPTDEDGLKMVMQQDGMKVMSNKEKKEMREALAKKTTT